MELPRGDRMYMRYRTDALANRKVGYILRRRKKTFLGTCERSSSDNKIVRMATLADGVISSEALRR